MCTFARHSQESGYPFEDLPGRLQCSPHATASRGSFSEVNVTSSQVGQQESRSPPASIRIYTHPVGLAFDWPCILPPRDAIFGLATC